MTLDEANMSGWLEFYLHYICLLAAILGATHLDLE